MAQGVQGNQTHELPIAGIGLLSLEHRERGENQFAQGNGIVTEVPVFLELGGVAREKGIDHIKSVDRWNAVTDGFGHFGRTSKSLYRIFTSLFL